MFWKYFWKIIAFILVVSLILGGGYAIYRFGFAHGINVGIEMVDGGNPTDFHPYLFDLGYLGKPFGHPLVAFPFLSLLIGVIVLTLFFGVIRHLIHYKMLRSMDALNPEKWNHYYHWRHRNSCWDNPPWEKQKTESESKEQPETEE
jgi:hypothetical protein